MTSTTHEEFDKNTQALDVAAAFPHAIQGRTILITGVNRKGIGYGTAEAFASQAPDHLIIAGRSETKLQECVEDLHVKYPTVQIHKLLVDLSSQKSIKAAAAEVLSWPDVSKIDVVVNNAGVMRHGETYEGEIPQTEDGIEDMFGINHLGHFFLTSLLMPKIIAASKNAAAGSTRIVNVSSSGTFVSPFRASDVKWQKPAAELPEEEKPNFAIMKMVDMNVDDSMTYIPTAAYGQSKTCNILFSVGLNQRIFDKYGILSLSINPGEVKSELARHTDSEWLKSAVKKREEAGLMHWKTLGGGASTTLVAVCDPGLQLPDKNGKGYYLSDCQIAQAPSYAVDRTAAEKLWQTSEQLVGQNFEW